MLLIIDFDTDAVRTDLGGLINGLGGRGFMHIMGSLTSGVGYLHRRGFEVGHLALVSLGGQEKNTMTALQSQASGSNAQKKEGCPAQICTKTSLLCVKASSVSAHW